MKVKMPKVPTGGGVVLFAQYVQPDEITIFTDCVDKAAALEKQCGCPLLKKERLLEILLAHELFHAVEEQYAGEIFTRTEKIELWRKPFSNRSVISCLDGNNAGGCRIRRDGTPNGGNSHENRFQGCAHNDARLEIA